MDKFKKGGLVLVKRNLTDQWMERVYVRPEGYCHMCSSDPLGKVRDYKYRFIKSKESTDGDT